MIMTYFFFMMKYIINHRKGLIMEHCECCANCKHCLAIPRNNKYNDVDYLCLITGYFISSLYIDRKRIRRFTFGGKELLCKYENKRG